MCLLTVGRRVEAGQASEPLGEASVGCGGALVRPLSPGEVEAERTSSRPAWATWWGGLEAPFRNGGIPVTLSLPAPAYARKPFPTSPQPKMAAWGGGTSGIAASASSPGQNILHHRELLKIQCFLSKNHLLPPGFDLHPKPFHWQ